MAAPRVFAATPKYEISLAEWSLNKPLFGGKMTNLDFPKVTKQEFGIDAVEYVNQFFKDKARDKAGITKGGSNNILSEFPTVEKHCFAGSHHLSEFTGDLELSFAVYFRDRHECAAEALDLLLV